MLTVDELARRQIESSSPYLLLKDRFNEVQGQLSVSQRALAKERDDHTVTTRYKSQYMQQRDTALAQRNHSRKWAKIWQDRANARVAELRSTKEARDSLRQDLAQERTDKSLARARLEEERIAHKASKDAYMQYQQKMADAAEQRRKATEDERREKAAIHRQKHLVSESSLINQFTQTKNQILDATVLGSIPVETASKMGAGALAVLMAMYLAGRID